MKKIHKISLFLSLLFLVVVSCETTELDLQNSPSAVSPELIEDDLLFDNIQLTFIGFVNGVNNFSAQVTRVQHMFGPLYDNAYSPASFNGIWNTAYSGLLTDIETLLPAVEEKELFIHAGAAKLMKAYTYFALVDMFGSVPFSEALQGSDNFNPIADGGEGIYNAMLAVIDDAIADLNKTSLGSPANDLYYDGDASKWVTLAKTLKLKIYNQIRLFDGSVTADINALIAAGDLIDTPAEDFKFQYGSLRSNPNTRHPWYNQHYESGNGAYLSNYFMWTLITEKGTEDPRTPFYFFRQDIDTTDEDLFTLECPEFNAPAHYSAEMPFCVAREDGYWGRDHGDAAGIPPDGQKRTVYGLYPAGGKYDLGQGGDTKNSGTDGALGAGYVPILMSSYVSFIQAEAALTMSTTGDPKSLLEDGLYMAFTAVNAFASLDGDAVAMDAGDISDYVDLVLTSYDDAANNDEKLEIIMKEYYISLWGNGLEAYNNYKRTGKPSNLQPTLSPAPGPFTRTFLYPSDYIVLNSNAAQKENTVQVFWDTNAAGFID